MLHFTCYILQWYTSIFSTRCISLISLGCAISRYHRLLLKDTSFAHFFVPNISLTCLRSITVLFLWMQRIGNVISSLEIWSSYSGHCSVWAISAMMGKHYIHLSRLLWLRRLHTIVVNETTENHKNIIAKFLAWHLQKYGKHIFCT